MSGHLYTQRRRYDAMVDKSISAYSKSTDQTARSRSIAINRSRSCAKDFDELAERANYEMATWRMYNRIIHHRMTRHGSEESSSSEDDSTAFGDDHLQSITPASSRPQMQTNLLIGIPRKTPDMKTWEIGLHDSDEEGIFQLDL